MSLPTRILRYVAAHPEGRTGQQILDAFPAYTERARLAAIQRLSGAHLIGAIPTPARWQITGLGLAIANSPTPPRWSPPRRPRRRPSPALPSSTGPIA